MSRSSLETVGGLQPSCLGLLVIGSRDRLGGSKGVTSVGEFFGSVGVGKFVHIVYKVGTVENWVSNFSKSICPSSILSRVPRDVVTS